MRYHPAYIEVVENPCERPYLIYTVVIHQKIDQGIQGKKQKPKVVIQHANLEQPEHYFVRLFKLYNSLCPKDHPADCLYLQPLTQSKDQCLYSTVP